jgi:hypothetical protein
VKDILGMDVSDGQGELAKPVEDLLLRIILALLCILDLFLQVTILSELGDNTQAMLLIYKTFVILYNVGMVQSLQNFYLIIEGHLGVIGATTQAVVLFQIVKAKLFVFLSPLLLGAILLPFRLGKGGFGLATTAGGALQIFQHYFFQGQQLIV